MNAIDDNEKFRLRCVSRASSLCNFPWLFSVIIPLSPIKGEKDFESSRHGWKPKEQFANVSLGVVVMITNSQETLTMSVSESLSPGSIELDVACLITLV